METSGYRSRSRRQEPKAKRKKERKMSHFQTIRLGGSDENQMICYLWDIAKTVEAAQSAEYGREAERLIKLGKQMRSQTRVEIRRYLVRRRRRNVKVALGATAVILCITAIFGFLIGVDQVSGDSIYPYLDHGDWIVYSRIGTEHRRNEVVVFEKNGECMVKGAAGQPGGRVKISQSGSRVVVNGAQSQEDYVALSETFSGDGNEKNSGGMGTARIVMDGQCLILGDNRSVSINSRDSSVGTVPSREVLGRVILTTRRNGE